MCGIGEPREDVALAPEALCAGAAHEARVQELDGRAALEPPVVAAGEPDVAHAALADQRHERPVADLLAGERHGRVRRGRRSLEEAVAAGLAALVEQVSRSSASVASRVRTCASHALRSASGSSMA